MMVTPDLGLEILLRSGRVDRLLLGDAWEASFVIDEELPELAEAVDGLRPGTRMLIDQPAREFLTALSADPSLDPLRSGRPPARPAAAVGAQTDRRPLRPSAGRRRGRRLHGGGAVPLRGELPGADDPARCRISRTPTQSVFTA